MGAPAALADTSDSPVTDSCLTRSSPLTFGADLSAFVALDFFERIRPVLAGPTDWATVVSGGSGTVLSVSLDSLASASASNVSAALSRSLATEASLCESSTPATDSSSSSPSALLRRDASVLSDVRGAIEFYFVGRRDLSDSQRTRNVYAGNAYTEIHVCPDSTSREVQNRDDPYLADTQTVDVLDAEVGSRWSFKDRLTLPRRWRPRMCMSCQVPGANEAKAPSPNMRAAAKRFAYMYEMPA